MTSKTRPRISHNGERDEHLIDVSGERARDQAPQHRVAVGTIVWLGSEVMFFAGLFAIYFTLRSTSPELWAFEADRLNFPFSLTNTIILVASSFTCQFGVFAAERASRTAPGGGRPSGAWSSGSSSPTPWARSSSPARSGSTRRSSPRASPTNSYGSAFYLTTGFHGLHVTGGLLAFLFVIGRVRREELRPPRGHQRDRRVVLLALRRRRLDRPLPRHLRPQIGRASERHPQCP